MNEFKKTIEKYLQKRAKSDKSFAYKLKNPDKNIDDCCSYILNQVRKIGNSVALCDEEVFCMAIHYYDEMDIVVDGSIQCNVVHTEPTDDDEPMLTF